MKGMNMDALLLAAGNSRRFGDNKLLYKIDGKPMYQHILDHMYMLYEEGIINHLILVTQYEQIIKDIKRKYQGVDLVRNTKPDLGISHSIRLGIEVLENITMNASEACLFAVSDQPYLKLLSLRGILETWQEARKNTEAGIIACANKEIIGNPVIFERRYYKELKLLNGDMGGKKVVKSHLDDTICYQISTHELEDIDVKNMATTN